LHGEETDAKKATISIKAHRMHFVERTNRMHFVEHANRMQFVERDNGETISGIMAE